MDATTRAYLRRRVAEESRRLVGVEPGGDVRPGVQAAMSKSLPMVAWELADGDGLAALTLALDMLAQGRREAA